MLARAAASAALLACVATDVAGACCGWSARFLLENDLFGGSDRYYTNAARVDFSAAPMQIQPESRLASAGFTTSQLTLFAAQYIYTASDIRIVDPEADDRPYAGWLHVGAQLGRVDAHGTMQDTASLSAGVIGPSARAEEAQNAVHRWRDFDEAEGWHTQMRDEFTLDASLERRWRFRSPAGWSDAIPHAGINLGTTFRQVRGGAMVRAGHNLPADLGISPMNPTVLLTGTTHAADPLRFVFYLFAGFEGRAVQHNTFLDGAPFHDSRSVDKQPLVFEQRYGAVAQYGRTCSLAYIFVVRSKEFETQLHPQSYGSVQLTLPLWWGRNGKGESCVCRQLS